MIIEGLTASDMQQLKLWYQFINQLGAKSTIVSINTNSSTLNRFQEMNILTWSSVSLSINPEKPDIQAIVVNFTDEGLKICDMIISFEGL